MRPNIDNGKIKNTETSKPEDFTRGHFPSFLPSIITFIFLRAKDVKFGVPQLHQITRVKSVNSFFLPLL